MDSVSWVTIYATVMKVNGLWGYSFEIMHDEIERQRRGSGLFALACVDQTHAELRAIGMAMQLAKKQLRLKGKGVKGFTIYTDGKLAVERLNTYNEHGYLTATNTNHTYVIDFNHFLQGFRTRRFNCYPLLVWKEVKLKTILSEKLRRADRKLTKAKNQNNVPSNRKK